MTQVTICDVAPRDGLQTEEPQSVAVRAELIARLRAAGVPRVEVGSFVDPARQRAWEYAWEPSPARWVAGGTMCYPRSLWTRHAFADVREAEDTRFVAGLRGTPVLPSKDTTMYVALVHAGNTSPKRTHGPRWRARPFHEPKRVMGEDWSFYERMGR